MCLIILAFQSHQEYPLIIAANRDEFYSRPTAEAAFWDDCPDVLAGRDLEQHGTWLGITKTGRYGAVTNYRDPRLTRADARSRGRLVSGYLCANDEPRQYLANLASTAGLYNGYNLLVGDRKELYYFSNIEKRPTKVPPGVHGLSNHLLNTPWPKVEKGKQVMAAYLRSNSVGDTGPLFEFLGDKQPFDDSLLPHTGVSLAWERLLSSVFIKGDVYGTRSSTVVLLNRKGHVLFVERRFFQHTGDWEESLFEFEICP